MPPTLPRSSSAASAADLRSAGSPSVRCDDGPIGVDELDDVLPSVYRRLRRTAASVLRDEAADFTLGATDLVHEAVLRVVANQDRRWNDRRHLLRSLALAMQHALADHARRRLAQKRERVRRESFGEAAVGALEAPSIESCVLRLNEALTELGEADPSILEVMQLRFLVGLSPFRIAATLALSRRAVRAALRTGTAYVAAALRDD